jgi:FAD/FMN-containing dehydrogenase
MGHDGTVRASRLPNDLRARLREAVGPANVLEDADVLAGYTQDWTGRLRGDTSAVVRTSASEGEIATVLGACADHGFAVVPQGGNTGLVGGGIAFDGAVTLSTTRMVGVQPIDELTSIVSVHAGDTLAAVQTAARRKGLAFGVDLAARDSATIGGMIATNAGGLHVIRHGPMRAQLVGVRAVRSTGEVVGDLRGLVKDNTGYHWPSILCGSEGTLAVITEAQLQLVARPTDVAVALFGFATADAAVTAASQLRRDFVDVHAIELVTHAGVQLVCQAHDVPPPFPDPSPFLLLVEGAGTRGVVDRLAEVAGSLVGVLDSAVAVDPEPRAALWRYRELHTESIARLGPVHKLDVTLPLPALAEFLDAVRAAVKSRRPEAAVWLFGHAGDGNIHVNVTGVAADDEEVDALVLGLVSARRGSISAEHGIGRAKLPYLWMNRSTDDVASMRALKHALDPAGILNPGVLLSAGTTGRARRGHRGAGRAGRS